MENYYDILGVSPDASKAEIERAYKRLSKAYHPDAGATSDTMFKKVHDIYKLLMDNAAREAYNREYTAAAEEEEKNAARRAAENRARAEAIYGEAAKAGRRASARSAGEDWSTPKKPEKPDIFSQLKKAEEYLEKGSWKRADDLYAEILKQKPKEGRAWLGRLLASLHVKEKAALADVPRSFEKNEYYLGCQKYCTKMLKEELEGYMETSRNRILSGKYDAAVAKMKVCDSPKSWQQVAAMFRALGEFKDAESLAKRCKAKGEGVKNDDIYQQARDLMERGTAESLVDAVGVFQKIPDWKDSEDQIQECYRLLADIKAKEADKPYQNALAAMKTAETVQDYNNAAVLFEALGEYRDAKKKARACRRNAESSRLDVMYRKAMENMTGDKISAYEDAIAVFRELDGWKDSEEQINRCQKRILEIKRERYQRAEELYAGASEVQDYLQAAGLYASLSGYRDCRKKAESCRQEAAYVSGMKKLAEVVPELPEKPERYGKVWFLDQLSTCNEALELFSEIPEWKDSGEKAEFCRKRAEELKELIPGIPEQQDAKKKMPFVILIAVAVLLMAVGAVLLKKML